METATRTFTEYEESQRDAWIRDRVENECDGCETIYGADGYNAWRPAADCPVHGLHYEQWFADLNAELDRRWPRA